MRAETTSSYGRRFLCAVFAGALAFVCCGCTSGLMSLPGDGFSNALPDLFRPGSEEPDTDLDEVNDFETRYDTPLLGDYISVQGNTMIPVRGIGLVTRLNGTGGDPPPSSLRTQLETEMRRLKIPHGSKLLAGRNTALVVVTAYVPPMSRDGQLFDVRVVLPPNSDATSLKGGYLLPTRLYEEAEVQGRGTLKGHEYATATGPILTAFAADNKNKDGLLMRGAIPGGATSKSERDLEVVLRKEYQSIRKSKQIADSIAARFHHYDRFGQRIALAEAKTHAMIELKVHPTYRNNFPRYQRVIRSIPLKENAVARRLRMERLAEELQDPFHAETAAVQLEALGDDAVPFFKPALKSEDPGVRFFAAEALAYLGNSQGVEQLREAAHNEPAFRIFALAALSVITDAEAIIALRALTADESLETQYGAVRALTETRGSDRALNTETFPNQFIMHQVLDSPKPRVHLARRRVPEVTIFGIDQKLMLPAVLSAGHAIRIVGHQGDEFVTVTRYRVGEEPVRRQSPRQLNEILRATAELGATYPDIVQMMIEAEQQHNLEGELGIDRLPQGGRAYSPGSGGSQKRRSKKKLGSTALMPGLFDDVSDTPEEEDEVSALEQLLDAAPEEADESNETSADDEDMNNEPDEDALDEEEADDETGNPVTRAFRRVFVEPFSGDSDDLPELTLEE